MEETATQESNTPVPAASERSFSRTLSPSSSVAACPHPPTVPPKSLRPQPRTSQRGHRPNLLLHTQRCARERGEEAQISHTQQVPHPLSSQAQTVPASRQRRGPSAHQEAEDALHHSNQKRKGVPSRGLISSFLFIANLNTKIRWRWQRASGCEDGGLRRHRWNQ